MDTMRLYVESSEYTCEILLERRITVLKGDSGRGKTTFVEVVSGVVEDVKIDCPMKIVVVTLTIWKTLMTAEKDAILIFDDITDVETIEFSSYCKKYLVQNNNYAVVISRETLGGNMFTLSYSVNSIFLMNYDESDVSKHYVTPLYNIEPFSNADACIVEDRGRGYEFFNNAFGVDVFTAKAGKSSIIEKVKELDGGYRNILVLADLAAYGCHIEQFWSVKKHSISNIYLVKGYECFEEAILRSNLFNDVVRVQNEFSQLCQYANNYLSWETYFKNLINTVTRMNSVLRCNDGSISKCYLMQCSECNIYRKAKCNDVVKGNKYKYMFEGTKYDAFTKLLVSDAGLAECSVESVNRDNAEIELATNNELKKLSESTTTDTLSLILEAGEDIEKRFNLKS